MQKQGKDRWEGLQMTHRDFTTDILPQESLLPKASRYTECVQEPLWGGKNEPKFDKQQ